MLVRESGDRLLKECVRGIIPLDIFVFFALFQGTSIEMDISLVKERGQIFFCSFWVYVVSSHPVCQVTFSKMHTLTLLEKMVHNKFVCLCGCAVIFF